MALITASPLVSAISGSIGAVNFAASAQGLYARLRGRHTNKRSRPQHINRTHYNTAANAYQSITTAQRNGWINIALEIIWTDRLGVPKNPTAFQLFMKMNLLRLNIGWPILLNPPGKFTTRSPSGLVLTCNTSPAYAYQYVPLPAVGGALVIVEATRPFKAYPQRHYPNWRIIKRSLIKLPGDNITAEYQAVFGALTVGEAAAIRVSWWNGNDQPSVPEQASCICT